MAKYRDRPLQWDDIIGRFESQPCSHHTRHALVLIERLRDEGARFWDEESQQLKRWRHYCGCLWRFLNNLGYRRDTAKQSLETAMREFIQEFEHSTGGMYEMLYGKAAEPNYAEDFREITNLFHVVYRSSTYALVSHWIDDKQEHKLITMKVDLTTGESSLEVTGSEMRVQRKYQKSTRRL